MFAPASNLLQSSRLPSLTRHEASISAQELAALLAFGGLAAVAVSTLHISFRVPGHAILRAVFPMAAGLALVPRRSGGLVMTAGAILTTAFLHLGNFGEIQSAAFVSLLALGPMLDLALASAPLGWRLYARFAAAATAANLLAFLVRIVPQMLFHRGGGMGSGTAGGNGLGGLAGGHDLLSIWPVALVSFTLCGAIAGLVSAAVLFRLRSGDEQ